MKKVLLLVFTFLSFASFAQKPGLDKVVKNDSTNIKVKITKITESTIEFTYPNESLVNSLDIAKVARIEFASGRVQAFEKVIVATPKDEMDSVKTQGSNVAQPIKRNTVAILPIPFINSETAATSEEMAKLAQTDVYNKFNEKAAKIYPLTVQDLRTTNNLLRKAGIDYRNVDETPIEDLQKILGVDHIVASKVSYIVNVNSSSSTYSEGQVKVDKNKVKGDDFSVSNTQVNKKFEFTVYFDIYKDSEKIYSETKKPFLTLKDSWMDSMQYLLKRCPIYKK